MQDQTCIQAAMLRHPISLCKWGIWRNLVLLLVGNCFLTNIKLQVVSYVGGFKVGGVARVSLSATLQTHLSKLKVAQSLESMNGTTCFNHPPFSNYLCTSTHSFKLKERRGSPQGNPTGSHDCHVASCLWRGCKYERRWGATKTKAKANTQSGPYAVYETVYLTQQFGMFLGHWFSLWTYVISL